MATRAQNSEVKFEPTLWLYYNRFDYLYPHLRVSLQTILCQNSKSVAVEILDETVAQKLVSEYLHPAFSHLLHAHKADYFRVTILIKFGGMYLDMDTIQIHNSLKLFNDLINYDISGYIKEDGYFEVMGSDLLGPVKPQCELLKLWKLKADSILSSRFVKSCNSSAVYLKYPLFWTEILAMTLIPATQGMLSENTLKYFYTNGNETYSQMTSVLSKKFQLIFRNISTVNIYSTLGKMNTKSPFIIYHNCHLSEYLRKQAKFFSNREMLNSNMLFGRLAKLGLSRCSFKPEKIYRGLYVNKPIWLEP